jgi:hypothetical protein
LEVFFPDGADLDLGFEAQSLDYTSIALAGLLDGLPCPQLELCVNLGDGFGIDQATA